MNCIYIKAGHYTVNGEKDYEHCSDPFYSWSDAVTHIMSNKLYLNPICEVKFITDGFKHTIPFYEFQKPKNYIDRRQK